MAKSGIQHQLKKHHHKLAWASVIVGLIILVGLIVAFHVRDDQYKELSDLQTSAQQLILLQKDNGVTVVDQQNLLDQIDKVQDAVRDFNLFTANTELQNLKIVVYNDHSKVEEAIDQRHAEEAAQAALRAKEAAVVHVAPAKASVGTITLPIIMYHKPPADFDAQMTALKAKGYTTVHMSDVANYLSGKAKPPAKPAVITFDDGFSVQLSAIPTLQKNNQKATLYLIVGGQLSHYCIGLLRIKQPCGDEYLNQGDVKGMMATGLIEIGAHTLDHPYLAAMNSDDQWAQINGSKQYLQNTFGVNVTSFAYPYGSFNATTVALVAKAGFETAVTTQPGVVQNSSQPLLLHRARAVSDLP